MLRLLAIIVSFAKGTNYDSSFIVLSGSFALITESQFIHSQKEMKGRMNPSLLSTAPELQLLHLRKGRGEKVYGMQTAYIPAP